MKYLLIGIIKLYRRFISPIFPPACRFYPTCSAYAIEALSRYGAIKGGLLMMWRVLRCNPFCKGGIEYVPDTFSFAPWRKA